MGLQLTSLVKGQEIEMQSLLGRRLAIDAFNWIYQFLSIIRQPDGQPLSDSQGRTTSHLSGLYYRTLKLMEMGIKPIYVFDGEPPAIKKATAELRRTKREEAAKEWKSALEKNDYETARKAAQRSTVINDEIISQSKELLDAMGVPCIQAEGEGEALCSVMVSNQDAYAVATQDYDSLLFGANMLIRNLSITGKRRKRNAVVEVKPEQIVLNDLLLDLKISREQLIVLGIVIGTDFNPGGILGYGPKKALELVREKKDLAKVLEGFAWDFPVEAEEIFNFFLNPKKTSYDIKTKPMDSDRILDILCNEHDFSRERIENSMKKVSSKKNQSSLGRFFR